MLEAFLGPLKDRNFADVAREYNLLANWVWSVDKENETLRRRITGEIPKGLV